MTASQTTTPVELTTAPVTEAVSLTETAAMKVRALLDRVREVDGRADQVRRAHPVDDQRYTAPLDLDVTVEGALVEEQLVLQP